MKKTNTEINIESIYNEEHDDKTNVFVPFSLEIYFTQDGKINNVDGERMCEIIDYLRSKSYALPYMGVDLVQAGIAEIAEMEIEIPKGAFVVVLNNAPILKAIDDKLSTLNYYKSSGI